MRNRREAPTLSSFLVHYETRAEARGSARRATMGATA